MSVTSSSEQERVTDAKKLLETLAESKMTQTAIHKLFNGHKNRLQLKQLLCELEEMKKIESVQTEGTKKIIWKIKK